MCRSGAAKDLLSLYNADISTASAVARLEWMYAMFDGLIGERNRLTGELGWRTGPTLPASLSEVAGPTAESDGERSAIHVAKDGASRR